MILADAGHHLLERDDGALAFAPFGDTLPEFRIGHIPNIFLIIERGGQKIRNRLAPERQEDAAAIGGILEFASGAY